MNVDLAIKTWAAEHLGTTPENVKSVRFEEEESSTCGYGTCIYPAVREAHVMLYEPIDVPHIGVTLQRIIDLESEDTTFAELIAELVAIGNR